MAKFYSTDENQKLEEKAWQDFLINFRNNLTSEATEEILSKILSPCEKREISRRLVIVTLLAEGKSYTQVSKILGVSPQTISAVKKYILKNTKNSYQPYKKKEKRIEPSKGISRLEEIGKQLSNFPTKTGKGRWRFLDIN